MTAKMKRREFITLLGGAAAWPVAARAQQHEQMRRVGVLISSTGNDPQGRRQIAAFQQGLQELGWMEGQNVRIDFRFLGDEPNRLKAYAAELVALKPDALLASGQTEVVALQQEAITIPIVFTQVNDPVGAGLVKTLARPGGSATGFTPTEFSIGGKMLEVLRDLVPDVKQVGVVLDPKLSEQTGMAECNGGGGTEVRAAAAAIGRPGRSRQHRESYQFIRTPSKRRPDRARKSKYHSSPQTHHRGCG